MIGRILRLAPRRRAEDQLHWYDLIPVTTDLKFCQALFLPAEDGPPPPLVAGCRDCCSLTQTGRTIALGPLPSREQASLESAAERLLTRVKVWFMQQVEYVVAVDEQDNPVDAIEKIAAHRTGILHRAFSIMLFNNLGNSLLQRRSLAKYHCPGLWANSCCGHPRPGEATAAAAARRLGEELGIACPLDAVGSLVYRAECGGGMVEHELVHLFRGHHDGPIMPDPAEVMDIAWLASAELQTALRHREADFAPWFRHYAAHRPDFLEPGS